jgi:signal transduction histidine kinase
MTERAARPLAWGLWALSVAALVTPLAFELTGAHVPGFADQAGSTAPFVGVLLFILTFATVGAVLASKRPSNPIGWLLSASALCYGLGSFSILLAKWSLPWSDWISNWVWGLGIGLTATFVLLLFPTGSLPSRRWRAVGWFAAIARAAVFAGNAFAPGVMPSTRSVNPVGVGGPVGAVLDVFQHLFGALFLISALLSIASVVVRFRRADPTEREQLRWLVYAAALLIVAFLISAVYVGIVGTSPFSTNIQNAIVSLSFVFIPLAIGFAVLKYRLYDIDVVINKTVVIGALAAFITAVYVGIVVGVGTLVGHGTAKPSIGLSIVATAIVAVAFQPVRARVERFANRLVYGHRATPYEVLSEFSSRMANAYESEDLVPRMARILAEGTGARSATVWLKVGEELRPGAIWPPEERLPDALPLSDGEIPSLPATLSLPVHHRGELLGAVSLTKPPGERLTPAEQKLAEDLASGAGLVLRNVRLTEELLANLEELRASRQRIVAAQDSERRRIERNIHDGAQQQLVALAVKARLARQLSGRDAAKANDLLEQMEGELSHALEDLRDLARGIYPPLLADKGLVAALESQATRSSVPAEVQGDGIGRYPAETEAAVYFCVLEALQNVAKYAGATRARICVSAVGDELTFEVTDDGAGFDPSSTGYGTGLQGMADRLAALGGSLDVTSAAGDGTTVRGRVPAIADAEVLHPAG